MWYLGKEMKGRALIVLVVVLVVVVVLMMVWEKKHKEGFWEKPQLFWL